MNKKCLLGLTLEELQTVTESLGLPRFTAKQIADWLYKKNVGDIGQMTNLSVKARVALDELYTVGKTAPTCVSISNDGTKKMLYEYDDHAVETAYIPDGRDERNTLCVSSQFGCKMGCRFCMTGRQGFGGNLTANQIINQMASAPEMDELTNMVFMGMGEPMDNLDEVLKAVKILTAPWGYAWSPRRITVSTIGLPNGVRRFLDECDAHLAISLHTPDMQQRAEIMPMQKAFPIQDTLDILRGYDWFGQRRLTFEYTVFEGLNDSPRHADDLVRLLNGLRCRVNLIAFNPIPDSEFKGANRRRMEFFRDRLCAKGLTATIRESKGQDIDAACGLLSTRRGQR